MQSTLHRFSSCSCLTHCQLLGSSPQGKLAVHRIDHTPAAGTDPGSYLQIQGLPTSPSHPPQQILKRDRGDASEPLRPAPRCTPQAPHPDPAPSVPGKLRSGLGRPAAARPRWACLPLVSSSSLPQLGRPPTVLWFSGFGMCGLIPARAGAVPKPHRVLKSIVWMLLKKCRSLPVLACALGSELEGRRRAGTALMHSAAPVSGVESAPSLPVLTPMCAYVAWAVI